MPKMAEYVQQLEHLKVDINEIADICDSHPGIKKWMYGIHNKDIGVKPHIHLYMNFGNDNIAFNDMAKWFNDEPHYFGHITGSGREKWARAALYLLHRGNSDKDKYQYDEDIIRSNYDYSPDIQKALKNEEKKEKYLSIPEYCEKVITGEILPNCPENYLCVFVCINDKGLIKKANNERVRRVINMRKEDRNQNVKVIFINGPGRSGKDFLAINFAQGQKDKSYCVSSSSNDSIQDYNGENTLILSDLRDDVYDFADLLKILDNHLPASMKSRYNNKYFIGNYIIITSSVDLSEWYKINYNDDREDMNQFLGRINIYIKIDTDNGTIKQYNNTERELYYSKYMFDDSVECVNFFPAAYKSNCKFFFRCVDVSPYARLENQIRMMKSLEDENLPDVLNCLAKEVSYLPGDIDKLKNVVKHPEEYN